MLRSFFYFGFACLLSLARAQDAAPGLAGQVDGNTYISPTGAFKVAILVLPALGGSITDTPNVVTFQDEFNTHISIAAFPQDATQRWELSTRGLKDYLVYFFSNFVLSDFKQAYPGAQIESAKWVPAMLDGSLITSILLPGGSMFADKTPRIAESARPPVAKRGNLLFVRNNHVFVISVELAEKVIEGSGYDKTIAQEDEILRQRLTDVVSKVQFSKPAAAAPSAPSAPPAAAAASATAPTLSAPPINLTPAKK